MTTNYLDRLPAEMRAALLAPSRHLVSFQAFAASYRKTHPGASLNEIQHAYQLRGGKQ